MKVFVDVESADGLVYRPVSRVGYAWHMARRMFLYANVKHIPIVATTFSFVWLTKGNSFWNVVGTTAYGYFALVVCSILLSLAFGLGALAMTLCKWPVRFGLSGQTKEVDQVCAFAIVFVSLIVFYSDAYLTHEPVSSSAKKPPAVAVEQ